MGGKDAIIVDADSDLDKAVDGVLASAFGYQGQKCSACSRAIVDAAGLRRVSATSSRPRPDGIKVGPADDPGNYMGPVISAGARKTILEYIEAGKTGGPRGGRRRHGAGGRRVLHRHPPSSPTSKPKARIFQEEIFGPVLAVTKAKDFEHALELANDTQYGLTGAVYSNNPEHLREARERFHVGNLYFNRKCTGAMVGAHPFGGFNMSGTDSKAGGPGLPAAVPAGQVRGYARRLSSAQIRSPRITQFFWCEISELPPR